MSERDIRRFLRAEILGRGIVVAGVIPSTNEYFTERDVSLLPEGFSVVADGQTHGRGRMGRTFFSPPGAGLYVSVLLRPVIPLAEFPFLTLCAAVAVCEMLRGEYGVNAGIKWVNDIYHGGLKVCGILTEALAPKGGGTPDAVVVGIGINTGEVAGEVRHTATSLTRITGGGISRNRLAAHMMNHFDRVYREFARENGEEAIRARYVSLLCMLDREIEVRRADGNFTAVARDVDANGALIVQTPDGRLQTLLSEDVRIVFA